MFLRQRQQRLHGRGRVVAVKGLGLHVTVKSCLCREVRILYETRMGQHSAPKDPGS